MKPERILVPINVTKCPLEVFQVVNGFAERPGVAVILLHVVDLNILTPENRVYEELCREAHSCLQQLARNYVHPMAATLTRVRVGNPAQEIIAQAKEANADLIILPLYRVRFWKRLLAAFFPRTIEKVIREAPCGVFVMDVKTRLNWEPERDQEGKPGATTDFAAGISDMRRAWGLAGKELLRTNARLWEILAALGTPKAGEHPAASEPQRLDNETPPFWTWFLPKPCPNREGRDPTSDFTPNQAPCFKLILVLNEID